MASYAVPIAQAFGAVIVAVPGSPSLVEVRAIAAAHPRDPVEGVFIAPARERKTGRAFGGSVYKEYDFVVTILRQRQGDVTTGIDANPALILAIKQAVDRPTLAGVPQVWDVDLVDNAEWENKAFGQGYEMSQFGLLARTIEPQNG